MKRNPTRTRPDRNRRRGSALIVVLGILAVMTALAVAFSVFSRTEQGGATSLKNSVVSRMSMHTAVGRVMEAIDMSFGSPSNTWAVPVWPYPWIASSGNAAEDYFQSRILPVGESAEAHLITHEVAEFLTPSQLAMARSAAIGWAPIFSSIKTEGVQSGTAGGKYGDSGRPSGDAVIGRYAFLAFDTTGLLDANLAGVVTDNGDRAETRGEDPTVWVLPPKEKFVKDENGKDIRLSLVDPSQFVSARNAAKTSQKYDLSFTSFADIRRWCNSGRTIDLYGQSVAAGPKPAFDLSLPPYWNNHSNALNDTTVKTTYFPADLFSSFTPALEALDPDGLPKVVLPTQDMLDGDGLNGATARAFAQQAMRAMAKVFANSREASDGRGGETGDDVYKFFERAKKGKNTEMSVSRARLATVAMIDAMDDDVVPGEWYASGGSASLFQPWNALPKLQDVPCSVVNGDGEVRTVKISDELDATTKQKLNPLNFPCTEPVPLLTDLYAFVTFDKPPKANWHYVTDEEDDAWKNSYVLVPGTLTIGGRAAFQNRSRQENAKARDFTLDVTCELLTATPANATVSSVAGAAEDDVLVSLMGESGQDMLGNQTGDNVEWKFTGLNLNGANGHAVSISVPSVSASLSDAESTSSAGSIVPTLSFEKDIKFTVKCKAKKHPEGGGGGMLPGPQPGPQFGGMLGGGDDDDEDANGIAGQYAPEDGWVFYPVTDAEEKEGEDVYIPLRFKTVVKTGSKAVQQVPAPTLEDDDPDHGWWVRVDAGVYHPKDSKQFSGKKTGDPWDREYAAGWATCVEPAFAFDTTSLYTQNKNDQQNFGNGCNFWLNDVVARCWAENGGVDMLGHAIENEDWAELRDEMQDKDNHGDNMLGEQGYNAAQSWLVHNGDWDKASGWLAISPRVFPDFLHAASKTAKPFCFYKGSYNSALVKAQLTTRIQNKAFASVGELGNVKIGPFETLSLLRAFRPRPESSKSDFHRVLDYFTVVPDRYPKAGDYKVSSDGTVDYSDSTELFSGVLSGRVNLNMPPVLRWSDRLARRVHETDLRNPYPVITALQGASLVSDAAVAASNPQKARIGFDFAALVASSIGDHAGEEIENKHAFKDDDGNEKTCSRYVVQRLSDIGSAVDGDENVLLAETAKALQDTFTTSAGKDADREAFVANSANAFATRGQTYLVVIRADAYMPRYGDEASPTTGSTLVSCTAVAELFRDPEFARYPDGSPLEDKNGNPVFFHNWFIRSLRIF